ncbi:hypothetical protein [Streptomyces sp. NPDC093598]
MTPRVDAAHRSWIADGTVVPAATLGRGHGSPGPGRMAEVPM